MVFFLTTPIGSGHLEGLIERFDRTQSRHFQEMTYADFVRRGRAPRGAAYVFTDRQRMSEPFRRVAIELWRQLEAAGGVRLFSNPARQFTRFGLMRRLFESGVNAFNAFGMDEFDRGDLRYPVFLRLGDDHSGPKSALIGDRSRLATEVDRLVGAGADPSKLLAIEFLGTADASGIYRKYGALRFGDRVLCQHVLLAQDWNVKTDTRIRTEDTVDESDAFFLANPHAERLRPIFEQSGIDYGRIDYALHGGRIQVWEINDNPVIAGGPWHREGPRSMSKLSKGLTWFAALAAMGEGIPSGRDIELDGDRLAAAMHLEGASA